MLILDAVHVNEGGSLILLKYLMSYMKEKKIECFFLLDNRVKGVLNELIDETQCKYIPSGIVSRYKFYATKKGITSIFCFNSTPPPIFNTNIPINVYFHNPYLIKPNKNISLLRKFSYFLKTKYIDFFGNNVELWMVQNQRMKINFEKKYLENKITKGEVMVLPFYPSIEVNGDVNEFKRVKNSFIYVSTYYPHKNHWNLIEAFCKAYDETKIGSLTLTLPNKNLEILDLICKKVEKGYPINNLGFINREDLAKKYLLHEYLIFPSTDETFGLGLVEAIHMGCKVIASDLDYVNEVCNPSLVFDPYDVNSIKQTIVDAMSIDRVVNSTSKVSNDIDKLINIITS